MGKEREGREGKGRKGRKGRRGRENRVSGTSKLQKHGRKLKKERKLKLMAHTTKHNCRHLFPAQGISSTAESNLHVLLPLVPAAQSPELRIVPGGHADGR